LFVFVLVDQFRFTHGESPRSEGSGSSQEVRMLIEWTETVAPKLRQV
jgi:hypothetical protein